MSRVSLVCCCLIFCSTLTLAGCGGRAGNAPKTVAAKGIVTYKGQPVVKHSVAFVPEKGMLASAITDSQGRFSLSTNQPGDGAMPGQYKVAISIAPDENAPMPGFPEAKDYKPPTSDVPQKYSDATTSGLLLNVDSDPSKNDFKIDLAD